MVVDDVFPFPKPYFYSWSELGFDMGADNTKYSSSLVRNRSIYFDNKYYRTLLLESINNLSSITPSNRYYTATWLDIDEQEE